MASEVCIVAIVKDDERYVFMFDDDSRAETLRTLGRFASNPELSFTWYDAAVLSQKIRQTEKSGAESNGESVGNTNGQIPDAFDRHVMPLLEDESDSMPDFDYPSPDDMWISDDPFAP